MKYVLALVVYRTWADEGAALESLEFIAEEEEAGDWGRYFEIASREECSMDQLMSSVCEYHGGYYHPPYLPFEKKDSASPIDRSFATIVHPIVLEGAAAKIASTLGDLFDQRPHRHCENFAHMFAVLMNLAGNSLAEEKDFTEMLNQILKQILTLNIPPLIPYGKSELDYCSRK